MKDKEVLRSIVMNLCWEIEKLPASEQQTKCSIIASELLSKVVDLDNVIEYFSILVEKFCKEAESK